MELPELMSRLEPFCAHCYATENLRVFDLVKMPGHAGFAYGFRIEVINKVDSWFLRLPPTNVNWKGTADVLRQVEVLNALDKTDVPHCSVKWSGEDLQWFGSPFFVVPWLEGDVLRLGEGEWGRTLGDSALLDLGKEVMGALARIHKIDIKEVPYLGAPLPFDEDVTRWDRFYEKSADPERLKDVPVVREKLLDQMPDEAPIGIFHGDFQVANLFCSFEGRLQAVIDWELTGIGATLNDLGWICTFSDPEAWDGERANRPSFLDSDTLIQLYSEAYQTPLPEINWFRALAAYKFAIITGLNLNLHRRGKRIDPLWEETKFSMTSLINRANELLG